MKLNRKTLAEVSKWICLPFLLIGYALIVAGAFCYVPFYALREWLLDDFHPEEEAAEKDGTKERL